MRISEALRLASEMLRQTLEVARQRADECARAIRAGINEDSCALVLCGLLISGD